MKDTGKLKVAARGEREIVMTRTFDAPRKLVFDAFTRPELIRNWLLGPAGWTMPVCEVDLRVGGRYRYEWRKEPGTVMGMGGVFREVTAPARLVSTETFDDPWYPGDAIVTITFDEQGGRTTVTTAVLYESRDARDGVLKSPMEEGVAAGYDRLAELLATAGAR